MFDGPEQEKAAISRYGASNQMMRPRTKLERLKDMRKQIESKLEEVNTAINLLEGNPQLTEIIDALEKVNV